MMNDQLRGRTVVIMPGSADGLRGSARTSAITAEARCLADAIVARLDVIDLFELDGRLTLVAGGEPHNVNAEILREIIRANFASKHIVNARSPDQVRGGLAVEYRPVEVSEPVVRVLLTAAVRDGRLIGRVPMAAMEAPRQLAEPAEVAEPAVISNPVEHAAGQRALARHAGGASGERTRLEVERGQQRLKELRNG
jgi:hypothetical protein